MSTDTRILANGRVLRYNLRERVIHWVAGLSYIYLLLSGLAFWTPWMWWLALFLGGGPVARAVHPWIGLIFTFGVVYMYGMWHRDMNITDTDREWRKMIGTYVRNEEEELEPIKAVRTFQQWAPVDRFNYGQKYLFWVMFWGGIVLFLTGMVLWFSEYIPWSLRFLRLISVFLHPLAFLVTLAGFIIHVYMGTAVVRGGFTSVIRGEVSESWARFHHRLWLERIIGQSTVKK
jgi:formate dehydrogenase subunit gamma